MIDALLDLGRGKGLHPIGREIHHRASLRLTKQVVNRLHFAQTHRQKGFDRLPLDGVTLPAAYRAGIRGAGWALSVLGGQLTDFIPCFRWTAARISDTLFSFRVGFNGFLDFGPEPGRIEQQVGALVQLAHPEGRGGHPAAFPHCSR